LCFRTYPNLFQDFPNLRLKTHVEHTVSFIQNQISTTTKVGLPRFQKVNKSTRSCNANLNPTLQVPGLSSFRSPSKDARIPNTSDLSKFIGNLLDLLSQFTGWGKDESNWTFTALQSGLVIDVNDGWESVLGVNEFKFTHYCKQQERINNELTYCQRFSRSSLCNSDHVPSGESNRPSDGLNACWFVKSLLPQSSHDGGLESGFLKVHDGLWDVTPFDRHLICSHEVVHV